MGAIEHTGIDVRSGTLDITISGFSTITGTISCTVEDIGGLDYEFEVTEDESAKDSLGQILGNTSITIFDRLGDGTSLIERFYDTTTDVTAKIVHTDNSAVVNTYNLIIEDEEVSRDQRDRKVMFRMKVDTDITFDVSDYFAGNMAYGAPPSNAQLPYEDIANSTTVTCAALGDFIKATIRELNTDNTEVFQSSHFVETLPSTSAEDGDEEYVMVSGSCADNTQLVIDELMRVAIAEGSILGTGFGKNFWTPRIYTGNSVQLSWSEVEDFESVVAFNIYKEIKTSFTGSACFTFQLANTENTLEYGAQRPSTFDITTDFKATSLGNYVHSGPKMDTNVTTKDGTNVANDQSTSFSIALTNRRQAGKGFRCRLTTLGMKKVMPWQTVTFNTDFPTPYQSGEYRISKASYNWKTDKSDLELYRIT